MPGAFSSLGKDAKSTVNDNFELGHKAKACSSVDLPVLGSTALTVKASEKKGAVSGSLEAKSKVHGMPTKLTVESAGKVAWDIGLPCFVDGGSGSFIGNSAGLAKVRLGWANDLVRLKATTKHDAGSTTVLGSATAGVTDALSFGASMRFCVKSSALLKQNFCASYKEKDYEVHAAVRNMQDLLRLSFFHKVRPELQLACIYEHALSKKSNMFTLATKYRLEGGDMLKAKLDSDGVMSLGWQTDLLHNTQTNKSLMQLTLGTQVNTKNLDMAGHKIGFQVAFNL